MPWQVPITVDGLEYPVRFNTENKPTQAEIDEAVQQILKQTGRLPLSKNKNQPGYLSQLGGALSTGYGQMTSGVGATFNALTGDVPDVAANLAEMGRLQREQQAAQTPEDLALAQEFARTEEEYERARGPLESVSALSGYLGATMRHPGAAVKQAVQSAPNALISGATGLAGYALGGLAGGAAGIETGPGAILTGIAGATAGGAISNSLMEAGPAIYDILNEKTGGVAASMTADQIAEYLKKNPDIMSEGLKTGAIRGTVIGAIEGLGLKGAGRLATIPERAAARAAQKTLVDAGVDIASKEAVEAALKRPALRSAVEAASKAAKEQFTSAGNLARMGGAAGIEIGASGAGELGAQLAAGQEVSPTEIYQEMLGEGVLSLPVAATSKALEARKYLMPEAQAGEIPSTPEQEFTAPADTVPAPVSPEEETMRNPALEIAKEVGEASTANLAAIGSEQSAAAMAEFNATLDEIEAQAAQPPVQPSEEAEAPVAEEALGVTPEEKKSADNAEAAPIEPTIENIEVPTPYVTGNGGQRGEIVAENGDMITVEWRDGTTTTVNKNEVVPRTAIQQKIKNKTEISQTSTVGSDKFTVFYYDENGKMHRLGEFLGETENARDRALEKALALAEENAREHNHADVHYGEKKFPVKKSTSKVSKTTEVPLVTPEEESLAAQRRADLLSAAADAAKGKTKAQVSPVVTAMVTPQQPTPQENAPSEIPLQESLPEEPQERVESREAEEAGVGDFVRGAAEGEEEVTRKLRQPYASIAVPDLEKLSNQNWMARRDYLEGKLRNNQLEKAELLKTPKQNWESREYNENAKINEVAASLRAAIQDMQLARPDLEAEFRAKSGTKTESRGEAEIIRRAKGEMGAAAVDVGGANGELRRESETLQRVSEQPQVSAKLGDTTSGGGEVRPDSDKLTSNVQKFASSIRAQFNADELTEKEERLKEKYYSINASEGKSASEAKDKAYSAWKRTEAAAKKARADAFAELRKQNKGFTLAQIADKEPFLLARTLEKHGLVNEAIQAGYIKSGESYVFQPQITPQGKPTPATEGKVTPGGVATERETDEQRFQRIKSLKPSQRSDDDIAFANAFSKRQKELKPQAGETTRKAFISSHTASIGGRLRKALDQSMNFRGLKGTVGSWVETLYNEGWRMALDARGNRQFTNGTEALGSSGLGKVGMNYADFLSSQPQTTAAEKKPSPQPSATQHAAEIVPARSMEVSEVVNPEELAIDTNVAPFALKEWQPWRDAAGDSWASKILTGDVVIRKNNGRFYVKGVYGAPSKGFSTLPEAQVWTKEQINSGRHYIPQDGPVYNALRLFNIGARRSESIIITRNRLKGESGMHVVKPDDIQFTDRQEILPPYSDYTLRKILVVSQDGRTAKSFMSSEREVGNFPSVDISGQGDKIKHVITIDNNHIGGGRRGLTITVYSPSTASIENGSTRQVHFLKPTTAAETQTPESLRVDSGAAGVVQSEPVEGSIPTDEKESAKTAIESTEKSLEQPGYGAKLNAIRKSIRELGPDSQKAQTQALNDLMAMPLADLQAAFEVVTGIPTKLANKRQLANNVLNEILAESRNEKLPETDETFRKAEIEAEEEIQRQNAQSLARIFNDKLRTNPIKGLVSSGDVERAIGQLQNSGEVPGAIFTWRGTAKELQRLVKSPAFRKAFPGVAQNANNKNAEGWFENGMAFIITDQVDVSDLDRARAAAEGTTPEVAAAKRVIAHENYHKGVALLSPKDQAQLVSLLRKLFPAAELDDLAKSYKQYADWRTNRASEYALLEEKMQKAIEEMDEVPRDGLLRELVDFLKAIWRKLTGQPKGEPKLRDLKDVVRLLRSTLKDAHKAQANRTANGGRVMMSLPAFRNFVPAVNLNGRIETGASHYEAWLKHAIRQIPSYKKDGLSDSEVKDLADKWLVDHPEAMANSMTKEGFVTDEGYLNRQDSLKKFLALGGKQRLDPGEVRDWLDSADVESARMSLGTNLIDAEYLEAVANGDMEKAQRMVDEAAKAAGYNVGPVFHRTKAEFTVFDLSKSSSGAVWGPAIYASLDDGSWNPASLKDSRVIKGYVGGKVIDLTQPSVLDLQLIGKLIGRDIDTIPLVTLERRYGSVAEGLKAAGFSAALHKGPGSTGNHIAVFEPNQIKSADPVTYDDAGNVIPLSQRFQPASPDIRFSLSPVQYSSENDEIQSSAQQTSRSMDYTPRQLEVHFAVRKAYDAMPKDNGVAVPLFELFDKTKEFVPDLNAQEFGQIVQGLYDDNAALLNTAKKMLYHGTPHKVDRFLVEKIGTGEGEQAFGHGLYFAESKGVAKSYKDKLARVTGFISLKNGDLIGDWNQPLFDQILDLRNELYSVGDGAEFDAKYETQFESNLYTVELIPDESEFLDWDKPLSEQSENVQGVFYELLADLTGKMKKEMESKEHALQSKAAKLGLPRKPLNIQAMIDLWLNEATESGKGLYDLIRGLRGKGETPEDRAKSASEYLASIGIPGIKYLDAGSRGKGEGNRNFVVFDENSVRIVKENEQPVFPILNRDNEPASSVVILPGKGMASLGTALSPEEYARHAELEAKNKAGTITPEETKEAEKLVEKAARRAGYNVGPVWHLSQEDFNEFSPEFRSQFGTVGPGFYFSGKPSKYLAKKRPVQRKFFLKISKPLPLDKEGMPKRTFMEMFGRTMDAAVEKKMEGGVSDGIINSRMMEGTYDGIYTVWNSEQIKSADPFTGVPLEQRFDVTSPDIRFSYGAADSSAAATYRNEVDVISKGLPVGREYQGAPMKGMTVEDHATFNQNAMGDAAERLLKSLSKDHSMEEIFELLQQPDFQRELGLFDPTMVKSDAAKLTYLKLVAQFKQRAWNASNKAKTEGQRIKANVLYRQVSQYYANLTTGGGQFLQSIQQIHEDPRSRFAFDIERAENEMAKANAEAVENQSGPEGMNPVKVNIENMVNGSGESATEDVLEDVEEDQDAIDLAEGEATLEGEDKTLWEKVKDWLREIGAATKQLRAFDRGGKASLSSDQRNAIAGMSKEDLVALIADRKKKVNAALKKLLGEESEVKTPEQKAKRKKRGGMIDAAQKRVEAGKEVDPKPSSDPTMRDVLREINKVRREIKGANEKPIQWAEILRQSPKSTEKAIGTEEYRKRIFDAMMESDAFKGMSDEQKGKLADLFSEAWEKKRTAILDKMLEQYSTDLEAAKEKRKLAKALKDSRNQLLELVNLGAYNNDELVRAIGERFGLKTEFTADEKAKLNDLAEKLQDDTLNRAKRNKLAREYLTLLESATGIPASELLSMIWVTSVLNGGGTIFSIATSFLNGFYVIMGNHAARAWTELARGNYKEAVDIMLDTFKAMSKWLQSYAPSAERAWNYLWTGDVSLLEAAANDPFQHVKTLGDIQRHQANAERLAKDPKLVKQYIGRYLRFWGRLLTALDAFNVMTNKAGAMALAMRQSGFTSEQIKEIDAAHDMAVFKKRIIETDPFFKGQKPTDSFGRAYLHSLAEAEMYASLAKMGVQVENADFMASESAYTMNPTGVGGIFYNFVKGVDTKATNFTKDFMKRAEGHWAKEKNWDTGWEMFLAHLAQFLSYQVVNAFGLRFARFAGNKFNQGLSFIPGVGLLRRRELSNEHLKGREQAFIDSIKRNQIAGLLLGVIGYSLLKAVVDEPDDEKRGWGINGGFNNLNPDQKRQKLARGEKEYTIRIGNLVWNYQNSPIAQPLAAIGAMADMIRFSPDKWKGKNVGDKLMSSALSGLKATLEIPALTQIGELLGTGVSSKDPTEQTQNRLVRALAGWSGGFMPRFLKDIDYMAEPTMRKYETFWQKTSSHIPVYRRYTGKDFYDILGNPVEKNAIPGSREFAKLDERPEYQILGALNSRGIWLTPANAEYRMIGKGRNRRRLTQEEADKYSLESGKEYRKMLIRYGARALRMPPEKAKNYISDLADKARDRALDRVARR